MLIDTEEYTTASEAARQLGVTRQRIDALIDDGMLDAERPWPSVTLVRLTEVEDRARGHAPRSASRQAFQRWLKTEYEITLPRHERRDYIEDLALLFTSQVRPGWDVTRREMWALHITSRLLGALDE